MLARALVVGALLMATGWFTSPRAEVTVERTPLAGLPLQIDDWKGGDAPPFEDDVVSQLGVDEYVNRVYVGLGTMAGLYVGYYTSQRQGDTIHSPQNCLPGAGWYPIASDTGTIPTGSAMVRVNRYVIQKGADRQVALYWYQGRGRVVANEYANKALLMWDAARLHRTNAGWVRILIPVTGTVDDASAAARQFATVLLPRLTEHLP
jgi:EpsI family protein